MSFQPLVNYAGYEHILNAAICFVHPGNGNAYGCAIEKKGGIEQNLSVYRVRPGANERELVHRWVGGVDSAAQIAQGGCVIHEDGSLEAWASAVPPADPKLTKTGFQGVWDRVPGKDDPYLLQSAILSRIAALEWFFAVPGTLRLGTQNAQGSGGEIQLADGKGGLWSIDATNGELRFFLNGPAGKVAMKLTG